MMQEAASDEPLHSQEVKPGEAGGTGSSSPRKRINSQFGRIVSNTKGQKSWYDCDIRRHCTIVNGYIIVSVTSFLLMAISAAIMMQPDQTCKVMQPTGRCCECLEILESQHPDNPMPMMDSWNSFFYGAIMIINSAFGCWYVYVGVKSENKYQLAVMFLTQALECGRNLVDFDLAFGPLKTVRIVLMFMAIVFMLLTAAFLYPLYKTFGWNVFRRGGAKPQLRLYYKTFQQYRAVSRLDVQSSFLLFAVFIFYLDRRKWYVLITLWVCDIMASRLMIKYLKRECRVGVLLSVTAKIYMFAYWMVVVNDYRTCYDEYTDSRAATAKYWTEPRVPLLTSVYDNYEGLECLAAGTHHDFRVAEMVWLNLGQAVLFRVASLILSVRVWMNFGRGVKGMFYHVADEEEAAESMTSFGKGASMNGGPSGAVAVAGTAKSGGGGAKVVAVKEEDEYYEYEETDSEEEEEQEE
jgi:hypothetical protein